MATRIDFRVGGDPLDVVTIDGDAVSYGTGAARPIVEARLRLAGDDRERMIRSFDGWSNGYVSAAVRDGA